MLAPKTLRSIAAARLNDADILLAHSRYDGALYIGGYVIELPPERAPLRDVELAGLSGDFFCLTGRPIFEISHRVILFRSMKNSHRLFRCTAWMPSFLLCSGLLFAINASALADGIEDGATGVSVVTVDPAQEVDPDPNTSPIIIPPIGGDPFPGLIGSVTDIKLAARADGSISRVKATLSLTNYYGKVLHGVTATVYVSENKVLGDADDVKLAKLKLSDFVPKGKIGKNKTLSIRVKRDVSRAVSAYLEGKYLLVHLAAEGLVDNPLETVVIGPIEAP